MLKYLLSAVILLLPGIISVLFDCKLSKSRGCIFSKYAFYSLCNCLVMFSAMIIGGISEFTVLTAFNVPKFAVIYGLIAVASSICLPLITCKRLPETLAKAFGSLMSFKILYPVLVTVTGVSFFALRILSGKKVELFGNLSMFYCVMLCVFVPLLILSEIKLIKGGFKKNLKLVGLRLKQADTTEFSKRFGIALLIDIAFVFSVFMFIPFETYLGNTAEFVFGFSALWQSVASLCVSLLVVLFAVELLLPEKALRFLVGLIFGLTLAAYVQSVFMNGAMSQMDGAEQVYDQGSAIINLIIWALIAIAPAVLALIGLKFWKTICVIGCVLVIGMQSTALLSLGINYERPVAESRLTTTGLYEVSGNDNTIVFVLDCFDIDNVKGMLEAEPTVFDDMHGFTGYTNVTGSYSFTHLAVPYLITGERIPHYNPTDEQFINAAATSEYYNSIADSVSSFGVYTDEFCINGEEPRSKLCNVTTNLQEFIRTDVLITLSQKASLYRALPFFFKSDYSYTSQDFNLALASLSDAEYYLVASQTDATMKANLQSNGLTVNPDYTDGCFRFIHTNGPHLPCYIDKDGNLLEEQTDAVSASLGSIKMVKAYLKALNELGLYEDATIIITSDHGATYTTLDNPNPDISISPIMFYKPSGAGYDEEFKFSSAPVSHDDVFPTIMASLGFEYESETGMKLSDVTEDMDRTRHVYIHRREPDMPKTLGNYMHIEYTVTGDANKDESWHETDNVVHCNGWEEFISGK